MTETRTIVLAGQEIDVPALPLRLNMIAYPLCKKLTNGGYADRYIEAVKADKACEVSGEEFADLAELAFIGAKAADSTLDRDAFDGWKITPPELLNAFFPIRIQTGGWVAGRPGEGQDEPGEAPGAEKPQT